MQSHVVSCFFHITSIKNQLLIKNQQLIQLKLPYVIKYTFYILIWQVKDLLHFIYELNHDQVVILK